MFGKYHKWIVWGGLVALLVIAPTFLLGMAFRPQAKDPPPSVSEARSNTPAIRVTTVRPRLASRGYARTVTQPAYIRGYYQADLMAHVAGPVRYIQKNIGDTIREGEVLVELDTPDLVQDVLQKQALVRQAQEDFRAAQTYVPVAQAAAREAQTTSTFRHSEYLRIRALAAQNAVDNQVVDEKLRDYQAARAAAEKADAELQSARVDIDVKQSRVAVARADLAHTQSLLGYAKVRAPFNGIIIARHVDPGTFVQNASTGHPTPVLSVVRTDIVTAVMWVPEKDAAYVTKNTRAILQFDALNDRPIEARVTRFSHWLDPNKGRDMRVEVDLLNAAGPRYREATAQMIGAQLAPLSAALPMEDAALQAASRTSASEAGPLKPGMYGSMKLVLQNLDHSYLLPDGAVFERAGQTCIFVVEHGKALLVPVKVQMDDGTRSVVEKQVRQVDPRTGVPELVWQPLTGKEQIVRTGQGELANGQAVSTAPAEW